MVISNRTGSKIVFRRARIDAQKSRRSGERRMVGNELINGSEAPPTGTSRDSRACSDDARPAGRKHGLFRRVDLTADLLGQGEVVRGRMPSGRYMTTTRDRG
jgi:hypothetical protein